MHRYFYVYTKYEYFLKWKNMTFGKTWVLLDLFKDVRTYFLLF